MIPEVAALAAAAEAFCASQKGANWDEYQSLQEAVEALRIRRTRPAGPVTYEETEREWGEVTVGDEIFSVKTGRWYEVTRTVLDPKAGTIKLNITGSARPIVRAVAESVLVKRGVLGEAADSFQLLWSAQTRPEHVGVTGTGPMIHETEEDSE